ncbi:MAG: hypothetical protein U0Q21_04015 [Dermatophilaceae bacterium]
MKITLRSLLSWSLVGMTVAACAPSGGIAGEERAQVERDLGACVQGIPGEQQGTKVLFDREHLRRVRLLSGDLPKDFDVTRMVDLPLSIDSADQPDDVGTSEPFISTPRISPG